ncbi:CheY chemotaxis protein or a CheY-like REC (receiver) domain [Prevotella sp. tc2-28]|uniref:response regulator n=1 Tax=Prevotella sp. tc2-28 TaxID=1761888 RepID=UPI000897430F|nr:response regulator [Prevotella sp. tc2-28]SEA37461.1 CheY chemotaxis protein or a CheY-like REC (receiver) domain [Prevotella sp. tc2-28]
MKKILIAEDNDSNYLLMTYILKGHYEFSHATNGQEAVLKALAERPDMVLMDLKMPVMDGLEATRQIKSQMPNLPVLAVTANAFDNDRQRAMDAGCCDFISKPVNAAECLKIIAKYI